MSVKNLVRWFSLIVCTFAFRPKEHGYDIYRNLPEFEKTVHDPIAHTSELPMEINGTDVKVESPLYTPDFRIEESLYLRYKQWFPYEEERPYRMSPHYKQQDRMASRDNPWMVGCTCTTVYKRLKILATCAVLTVRHILTTATSTEIILRKRRKFIHFQGILGAWYDNNRDTYNSSMYATPASIHYHPRYVMPRDVNRSHPLPVTYDLALWTTTHRMYSGSGSVVRCARGSSHSYEYKSSTPEPELLVWIVGFQFIRAYKRVPVPWIKYAVRTRKHVNPCPKTEWGWFHCVKGNWAKFGLDSGANMHRAFEGKSWRYDGLIGLNTVSMKLRSYDMIHYFTVLDTQPVIDFLYRGYMGFLKPTWLDTRFYQEKGSTLTAWNPKNIYWDWKFADREYYRGYDLPNY